jgi:hypothetical protein
MNSKVKTIAMLWVATFLFSCNQGTKTENSIATSSPKEEAKQVVNYVMTKEE